MTNQSVRHLTGTMPLITSSRLRKVTIMQCNYNQLLTAVFF